MLAHNKPADDVEETPYEMKCDKSFGSGFRDAEEPADETTYDESFGVDFLGYNKTVKERKANGLAAEARNEKEKAFVQSRANDAITDEEEVAFAQTQATNNRTDGRFLQQRDETATATREVPETK